MSIERRSIEVRFRDVAQVGANTLALIAAVTACADNNTSNNYEDRVLVCVIDKNNSQFGELVQVTGDDFRSDVGGNEYSANLLDCPPSDIVTQHLELLSNS